MSNENISQSEQVVNTTANSTANPSKSNEPTANTKRRQQHKEELLNKLATQLLYYFSSQNLSTDTYLKTIMDLNSGYVPVSILMTFAKITLIIHKNLQDLDGDDEDEVDVSLLLRQAAEANEMLDLVLLNQNGNIIKDETSSDENDAAADDNEDKSSSSSSSSHSSLKGQLTLFAIGPSSDYSDEAITSSSSEEQSKKDGSIVEAQPSRKVVEEKKAAGAGDTVNIVILRDVPADASEDDVRSIFQTEGDGPKIASVQREVGNCWFVTFDPSQAQQNMADLLLSLRSRKILNEPVRARLKQQSLGATTASTTPNNPNTTSSDNNSRVPSSSSYNPYRSGERNNNSNSKNKSPVGSSSSKGYYGQSQQIYSGDRVYYGNGNRKSYNNGGRGGGRFGAGGGGYSKHPRSGNKNNFTGKGDNNGNSTGNDAAAVKRKEGDKKIVEMPTPSCEKQFPTLGGESPKSTIVVTSEELNDKKEGETNDATEGEVVSNTATESISLPKLTQPHGGYAAALLKAAPVNESTLSSSNAPRPVTRKIVQKNDSVSTGTVTTDDGSSDGKSSLSSRPESEKGGNVSNLPSPTVVTTTATSGGWGGGRSFADILKRQETES